jgi:hypothetical protein
MSTAQSRNLLLTLKMKVLSDVVRLFSNASLNLAAYLPTLCWEIVTG